MTKKYFVNIVCIEIASLCELYYKRQLKENKLGLIFLILGLQIFIQNIKVGGGKKIKIKITKFFFFI